LPQRDLVLTLRSETPQRQYSTSSLPMAHKEVSIGTKAALSIPYTEDEDVIC
jgi:hypothetical protein